MIGENQFTWRNKSKKVWKDFLTIKDRDCLVWSLLYQNLYKNTKIQSIRIILHQIGWTKSGQGLVATQIKSHRYDLHLHRQFAIAVAGKLKWLNNWILKMGSTINCHLVIIFMVVLAISGDPDARKMTLVTAALHRPMASGGHHYTLHNTSLAMYSKTNFG